MTEHYLDDATFDALVDRLAGPIDPHAEGWTRRDEMVQALMDAHVWPARVSLNVLTH